MILAIVTLALILPSIANAQDALSFEVASIKVRTEPGGSLPSSPDRFNRTNVSLVDLIAEAYGVQRYQVTDAPQWAARSVRFDVMAKAPFVPTRQQMLQMVQRLLSERFALRTRRDTRELPAYTLRIAREDQRTGKQLIRTNVACNGGNPVLDGKKLRANGIPECGELHSARPGGSSGLTVMYRAGGQTITRFAAFLSQYAGRTVIDRTGLSGTFDIDLAFQPDADRAGAPVDAVSIFTALEEQLGLKLEPTKGPVEVVVIESAEMPTPD